ncbi:MAG: class I SAM-dependent rRNA methyltransferase [Bdellovibrio sp. CG10_big_fil_rev_8_21_14_0_10_47_8]|nr:MAG: class I SAM-dependent rRNA methyltransferase [Bdellovibrio sp. CG10_big_fil_rev_8_21_14_0_10_47_8]
MNKSIKPTVWRLRTGADRRIRGGHPWTFSNELAESPKGHTPGAPVVLLDAKGGFLASGYGNPHSLIAFRALSFKSQEQEVCETEYLQRQLVKTWWQRHRLGFKSSFRWCYGEGDFLPGLVIDRYLVHQNGQMGQVFAVQILTAGMSAILQEPTSFFENLVQEIKEKNLSDFSWEQTAVVLRNDVQVRRLEGLEIEAPRVLKTIEGMNLSEIDIEIKNQVLMTTDLIEGQKTGFFLDQAHNISLLCDQLKTMEFPEGIVRVLDLCCYVGQWSTQITHVLQARGLKVEVTAVDVSDHALSFAAKNIERQGAVVNIRNLDVLKDLGSLPDRYFDVVIADPPAFIKAKKDVPTGRHAYLKLNTSAFKMVRKGGLVASCSCSGLFEEAEMIDVIRKAISRGENEARCIQHGGHSADHPVLLAFREGFYLKMFVHHVL